MSRKKPEIEWNERPQDNDVNDRIEIYRIKKKGMRGAVILSEKMIGTYMHFWGGRSEPCMKKNCRACEAGNRARWYGWIGICVAETHQIMILEITRAAAEQIKEYLESHEKLRGAKIAGWRKGKKENGKLTLEIREGESKLLFLPKEPEICERLKRMWETKRRNLEVEREKPNKEEDVPSETKRIGESI